MVFGSKTSLFLFFLSLSSFSFFLSLPFLSFFLSLFSFSLFRERKRERNVPKEEGRIFPRKEDVKGVKKGEEKK